MKWYTSDLHFNHKNILTIGKSRPFKTIDEMGETFIKNWNNKVLKNDDVYCLGDMFWNMNEYQIQSYMDKLNGNKHLILGNHDRIEPNIKSNRWVEIVNYKEISDDNNRIILFHFPISEWQWYYYNSYHFYGHTHGTFNLAEETLKRKRPNGNCWDVGVDNNNFEPVSFEEIRQKIEENKKKIEVNNGK